MIRYLFFFVLLTAEFTSYAQTVKTIPGVFIYSSNGLPMHVSSVGNSVSMNGGYNFVGILDISKGTMLKLDRGMNNTSADHRYLFKNDSYVHRQTEDKSSRWAFNSSSIGTFTDTIVRTITGFNALAIDEQGNYIASRVWNDSSNWHAAGMAGIYKVDRITGKILQTFRTDTLYACSDRNGCPFNEFFPEKKYVAFKRYRDNKVNIYPFGKQEIISIAAEGHTIRTDGNMLYTIADSTTEFSILRVFDALTGKQLARKIYSRGTKKQVIFRFSGGNIYHVDFNTGILLEDRAVNGNVNTLHSWDINNKVNVQADQSWDFAVLKGPSFLFTPYYMDKAEAGGVQTNTAFVFNFTSTAVNLKVYPFFNRNADDIAKQESVDKKDKEYWEKIAKDKAALQKKKDDLCNPKLGVGGYKKGFTVMWAHKYRIVAGYDCARDEYKLWTPVQPNASIYEQTSEYVTAPGDDLRNWTEKAYKQYYTCTACDGDGHNEVTEYTTKTKDLPWGYFSGIQTKKITTTTTTRYTTCKVCNGQGVVLY